MKRLGVFIPPSPPSTPMLSCKSPAAISTDILLPAPSLLQLYHNCWQSCQHHPDLQIGEFYAWVFLNYAPFPFFYTVQSTHPCFQWEHHHPVWNKKNWHITNSRAKRRVHLVCFKISDSIKLCNSCRLLFRTKLQCTVTLGHNGHLQAPLYKFLLYFVQCLYCYMKYLHKKNKQTKCQLGFFHGSVNYAPIWQEMSS